MRSLAFAVFSFASGYILIAGAFGVTSTDVSDYACHALSGLCTFDPTQAMQP